MGTLNVTGAGGTAGHPSNGRVPYLVENTIDLAQVRSDTGPDQNDVLQCIDIPAETLVMAGGVEVLTALASSSTLDVGITGVDPDIFVDAHDATSTGYAQFDNVDAGAMSVVSTADTLDVLLEGASSATGKIRVWAVLCDISGIDENDRNTATQHDTVS